VVGLLEREGRAGHETLEADHDGIPVDDPNPKGNRTPSRTARAQAKAVHRRRDADLAPSGKAGKLTAYPTEALRSEVMRLGAGLGAKTQNDCVLVLLELGVEAARRRALKADQLEDRVVETHEIALTALAYLMHMAAVAQRSWDREDEITKAGIEEGKQSIMKAIRREKR
jgi:hypothetical protein